MLTMAKHLTENGVAARLKSDRATSFARTLRSEATPAEKKLWYELRKLKPHRFRRQVPFGPYIADFACHAAKLIIEIDGDVHDRDFVQSKDAARQEWLEGRGYRVLRFANRQVEINVGMVVRDILAAVVTPSETD